MLITNRNKLYRNLFLYRSFLFKKVIFETDIEDDNIKSIVNALNIKNKYERIYYIIDNTCNYIDNYYDKDICRFKNNKCICHRDKKLDYENGCCRKCIYQSDRGCTTKNVACKMFNCSYVKDKYKVLTYDDLLLIRLLSPLQRYVLKCDYFSSIEDVSKDLSSNPIVCFFRVISRVIKMLNMKEVNTNKHNDTSDN